ncbi:MAG: 50S ribosome-binding GTPase [candidate division Zixibacteria bacterium]|nr:50S ribosome-binding GTPase [candidate division Zixibacteria bacterium]
MPANLPPQYYELEREFRREQDPVEKLRLGQELLAMMPKHKGTDKLQADLKAKISKLRQQIEGGQKKHGVRHIETLDHIEREGAAQVILIGPPNSGKSSLLASLTHARPPIADYPYTSREPLAGMMDFETLQIQLIDTPPISAEQFESHLLNLIRSADLILLIVDSTSSDLKNETETVFRLLEDRKIRLCATIPVPPDAPQFTFKKTIIVVHKYWEENSNIGLDLLKGLYPVFQIVTSSVLSDEALNGLKAVIFESLGIIRVYTKRIGQDPILIDPIILPIGGTVEDAANTIHKDFAQKLQFAKVWGKEKFDGQRVKNNFALNDGDIIEFHI